jgi:hypothetical protein
MDRQKYVVLKVVDGAAGWMDTYSPQVAMVHEYDSPEDAATCNVGSHPDARERGKPYRVVVIPWDSWLAFDVHSNHIRGRDQFEAVPTENPPIRPLSV